VIQKFFCLAYLFGPASKFDQEVVAYSIEGSLFTINLPVALMTP
jgi:hypothetical protein